MSDHPGFRNHHQVTVRDFSALAGGRGDARTIVQLRHGQLSKRLLLIRALLDSAPPDSTGPLRTGLSLLDNVQSKHADIASQVLSHPHVGAWAAHALRTIHSEQAAVVPLDLHLGHLASVAASAAIQAEVDFDIEIPARDGLANLPMLGAAVVPATAGLVRVHGTEGCVLVDGRRLPADLTAADPAWLPIRRLHAEFDGLSLTVELDDIDPYRNCHGLTAADRLDQATVDGWQRCLDDAWPLLVGHHRHYAEAIAAGLVALVPLTADRASRGMNATSMDAFGSMLMSPPTDGAALAVAIVHEFQHGKLGALLDLVPLHDGNPEARFYAPWRDDPRPLGGLLHGAYAFLGVTNFYRVQCTLPGAGAEFAQFEFARWRERVRRVIDVIAGSGCLNPAGTVFVAGMRATLEPWLDEPVPIGARILAQDAADDHHTSWRVRNLRPRRADIQQLVKAWRAGDPPPMGGGAPADVIPSASRALVHSVRLDLLGLRIREADRFARLAVDSAALAEVAPDASRGDLAYARGDYASATAEYRAQIVIEPDNRAHWAGLALAVRRLGPSPVATALLRQPEIVFAVYQEIAVRGDDRPEADTLADWLAGVSAKVGRTGEP